MEWGWWARFAENSHSPLGSVGARAGGGESAASRQAVRLNLALAGGSCYGRRREAPSQRFPQEQRGRALLG